MRSIVLLLAPLLAAATCQGPDDSRLPTTGPQTLGETPAPRTVWKDATGATASIDGTVYVDSAGLRWFLDVETGRGQNATLYVRFLLWSGAGCTGTAYVYPVPPRFPFKVDGDTAWHVRPDTLQSASVAIASEGQAGGPCTNATSTPRVVPLAETVPAVPVNEPTWAFSPPLHPDFE
jgi:hypothetical protein